MKTVAVLVAFTVISGVALAKRAPVPAPSETTLCAPVIRACQKAGFGRGQTKHGRKGLWTGCVRPISVGQKVIGVKGVSKKAAKACLNARHQRRNTGKI